MTFPVVRGVTLGAFLLLAACQTPEEKADAFYQSGLTLLAEGDTARALVELRNVFEHDGFHKDARLLYADTLLEEGQRGEAYGQYLRLIEQYPDTVDVRLTLAEIALTRNDWREVNRHGKAALELAPTAPRAVALRAAMEYREAVRLKDVEAQLAIADTARSLYADMPANIPVLRILIDAVGRGPNPEEALPLVENALALTPDSFEFHTAKLRLLTQMDNDPAALAQLELMFARFPDNPDVRTTLVNWHLQQRNFAAAEKILRDLSGDPKEDAAGPLTVVEFLRQSQGVPAAQAELTNLIAASEGSATHALYRAMSAAMAFDDNPNGTGLSEMAALVTTLDADDQGRRIKAMYARMLDASGDRDAASALVEEILRTDRTNVAALKLRAGWAIVDDAPDRAINDLRTALSQTPRDHEIMLLMATAHERAGFPELAGERLALAVEISNAAVGPSVRYARFLIGDGRTQAAASVLNEARRRAPENLELISVLSDLYLSEKDWFRATALLREVRALTQEDDRAVRVAAALESAILAGQNRTDESLAVLQNNLSDLDDDDRATLTIALAQIRAGKVDEARTYLGRATSQRPDNLTLKMLVGSVAMMDGDADSAEETFRAILTRAPGTETAVRLLYSLLHLQGRDEEKAQVLNAGLTSNPASSTLKWMQAGALEQGGDIEGAIAVYEQLYAADSSNVIVANNLASLLASYRDDDESLNRAFRIARRLRGMDVPAFQDTYGWIAFRRGQYAEAVDYLKPAADALSGDPLVQYHLGRAYYAVGQLDDAEVALRRALDLAEDHDRPQFEKAREVLSKIATDRL